MQNEPPAELVEIVAAILLGRVNAPEQEIYRTARAVLTAVTPQIEARVVGEINDDALVERIARIIDPSSWAVMDSYLTQTKRKYRGQNVGWPADQFQDKASMAKARAILALFPQVTGTVEVMEADREVARAALDIPPDAATSTCGLEKHFAAHREAAEARVTGEIVAWLRGIGFGDADQNRAKFEIMKVIERGEYKESQP